jgi:hypothetical protein
MQLRRGRSHFSLCRLTRTALRPMVDLDGGPEVPFRHSAWNQYTLSRRPSVLLVAVLEHCSFPLGAIFASRKRRHRSVSGRRRTARCVRGTIENSQSKIRTCRMNLDALETGIWDKGW